MSEQVEKGIVAVLVAAFIVVVSLTLYDRITPKATPDPVPAKKPCRKCRRHEHLPNSPASCDECRFLSQLPE
jgi:hypothetical protein